MMGLLVDCKSDVEDATTSEPTIIEYETLYKKCSLCEEIKIYGTYDVDGASHIVCDDCYPTFATELGIPVP